MDSGKLAARVFGDGLVCGPDLMRIADGNVPDIDRRGRARLPLCWTVYLIRSIDIEPVEGKTKNISSDGFYCFAPEPFVVGESIRCIINIPAFDVEQPDNVVSLECRAKVVRVEPVGIGKYGVACHIEDYRVVPGVRKVKSSGKSFVPLMRSEI